MVEYLLSLEETLNSEPQYIYRKQGNPMTEQGISQGIQRKLLGVLFIFLTFGFVILFMYLWRNFIFFIVVIFP